MNTDLLIRWFIFGATVVAAIMMIYVVAVISSKLLNRHHLLRRKLVLLELTPPVSVAKSPDATRQLFSVIHGLRTSRRLRDRLTGRQPSFSFEIVSTRSEGVRYIVTTEKRLAHSVQQAITAYLPDVKVTQIEEYIPLDQALTLDFKQTGHYIFPLAIAHTLEQHDPLAFITGAMTKLDADELVVFQMIVTPVTLREASILSHKILSNEDMLTKANNKGLSVFRKLGHLTSNVLLSATELTGEIYHGSTKQSYTGRASKDAQFQAQVARRQRPARTLSAFELELMESMHQKVTQPLFQVSVRVLVKSSSNAMRKERLNSLKSALSAFSVPPYQELKAKWSIARLNKHRRYLFTYRLPTHFQRHALILSVAEVSSLYHFPHSRVSKTDNLAISLSRTLPAPLSLKGDAKLDVVIGKNAHHGSETLIGLTDKERERHMYIIGGTGNGKTTMLQYAIIQDMQNGKGLAIIDPHGDMAETLLRHVPEERLDDVVYLNPDDLDHPIALNLLELTPGLTGNALLREKDLITESVISVFRKIFSEEDTGGHRIEYVLRNAIHTALTVEGATIFTVLKLLQNAAFRKGIVSKLKDEDLIDFWKNELGQAGNMQRVKMSAGITAKIGRFNSNAAAKLMLGHTKSTIDFDGIINSGKILICNFSKGLLGEDVSELFGITILAKLQLASLRRARMPQHERRPFYLYVDEFQNFATASFVQMLSESRKYKLFMTMAEQSTSQQKDQQMVNIILANVGTVICFRTGNPSDERLLLPLFSPSIEQGEIANLSAYNFYARLSSVLAQEPLSGVTLLLSDMGSEDIGLKAVAASRDRYAVNPESKDNIATKSSTVRQTPKKKGSVKPSPKATVKIPGE